MRQRISAIYARQSVDRLDSISTESQIEFCQHELRDEEYKIYIDKGYSGKNTSRPQFQKMLSDIRRREIRRVICYRLDRISRSVLDFAGMIDEFQKYDVEFVSCNEKFDTSTPMGRAMISICMVFAQLERETIQARVADAYKSRSVKGFYMGGRVPYGYRLEEYMIEGKKTSHYVVVPEEAEAVRLMYSLYARPQTSIGDVVRYLDAHHIENGRAADRHWDKSRVTGILRNPIYLRADLNAYEFFQAQGARLHNGPEDYIGVNGCYLYRDKEGGRKTASLEKHHIVLAPHEGIVSSDLWLKARRKCLTNQPAAKPLKARNSWLAGKIKCGKCGYALVIKKARTGVFRYYICSRHLSSHGCEGVGGLNASMIESLVLGAIRERLGEFRTLYPPQAPADGARLSEIRIRIAQTETDIHALVEKLSQADSALTGYINQMVTELDEKLQSLKAEEQAVITASADSSGGDREITGYMDHWEELTVSDKMLVVDALIAVIRATKETVSIQWRI